MAFSWARYRSGFGFKNFGWNVGAGTYRFPLKLSPAAKRLCVLETHDGNSKFRCLVGPDPQHLAPVELAERDGSYSFIEIPAACRVAGDVTVRLEECVVSGFALTT